MNPHGRRSRAVASFSSFDSVVRDVRYACRSLRRASLVAFTIVTTVGLGLGLVAAVFTILNGVVFQPDAVRSPQELFAVTRQAQPPAEPEGFTRAQYEALLRETDVFSDAFALGGEIDLYIDRRRTQGTFVSGNFFQVLGTEAARGRTFTPSDDERGERAIVLSHHAWSRYFGSDPGVLRRTVEVSGAQFQIVGVMPEGFRGLALAPPDFWAPLSTLREFRRSDDPRADSVEIVGRLEPGSSPEQALAQLVAWDLRRAADTSADRPAGSLVLEPRQGTVPLSGETLAVFVPLFFAFGLILAIGCANVANLLLARAVARQREIAVRLAIGASRRRVVAQLLTESVLLALVAAALGFVVSRLVLEGAFYYITTAWADLGDIRLVVPPADWRVVLFLIVAAIASTLFFALAPALQATRFDLVRPMQGEVAGDARPGRVRHALVALQVMGSVLLLVCAAIFLRSSWLASSVDPGVRTADTVFVNIGNEQRREAVLDVFGSEPSVASVGASAPVPLTALAEGATRKPAATLRLVSPEYFEILGVDVTRGRAFGASERSPAAAVAVVSAGAAGELWPGLDPIGQVLRLEPDAQDDPQARDDATPLPLTAVVVGVARDVPGFRIGGERLLAGPDVYLPVAAETAGTSFVLRVRGDPEVASRAILERLSAIDPSLAEVIPLRELARFEEYLLEVPFWLTLVLGALALFLTVSGLFGVLSYLVEQRTREIGVRMALGASRRRVGALVLSQSARPVGIGVLIGLGLPAALGAALLATPAAAVIGQTVRLFDPLAYAGSVLAVVAACALAALVPVLRAARVDPIGALRQN